MLNNRKIVVIMPAYNASHTLEQTYRDLPMDIVDEVVLVDDASDDDTTYVAQRLGIHHVIRHTDNRGYGGNQKTCYNKAKELDADIIVMIHPDYQYTPRLLLAMVSIIANDVYPVVLGSRILGKGALKGGMPLYKYFANRILTFVQNLLTGEKLSEYHTGYRAFRRDVLDAINYEANSDDFLFDNQMLSQVIYAGFEIGEITCPTKYFKGASSINFVRSLRYGRGVLWTSLQHFLQRHGLGHFEIYKPPVRRKHNNSKN